MANIVELDEWTEGIYQLEEEDLVLGGAEGIDNLQAKQLAARTRYLKLIVEALGNDKQPIDAMLTALAALVTSADKTLYFTGPDAPALTPLTAFIRTLLASVDGPAARVVLGAISADDLTAALDALVNGAPGYLNQLNEFAAALGNDANYAATIANALALKAPLDSPTFSGTPTAPTPAQFDNDTSLATTAFVQRALGNSQGSISYALPTSIPSSAAGALISIASGATTLTLPALSSCPSGSTFRFVDSGQPGAVIQRAGADTMSANGNVLTSFTLGLGDTLSLTNFGQAVWIADYGTARDGYSAAFGSSLAANGYQKLPSGLIIQWGTTGSIASSANATFTYPIAFPSNVFSISTTSVQATDLTAGTTYIGHVTSPGLSSAIVRNLGPGSNNYYVLAIGR